MPRSPSSSVAAVIAAAVLLAASSAAAAAVQGTLAVPEGFEAQVETTPSMWLIENGVVPIAPPLDDPRTRMVVVLEGGAPSAPPSAAVTVALRDMRLDPPVVAVAAGTSIDFKNEDHAVHAIYSPTDERLGPQPQAPGGLRTFRFGRAGTYEIRCREVPHVRGTVLVLAGGQAAVPQSGGAFRLENVPAGKYTLRVWYAGEYLHSQPLEVASAAAAVQADVTLPARKGAKGQ